MQAMRAQKRKRLAERGWKVSDPSDFLNLSPEEIDFVEIKLALSRQLREARKKKGVTQQKLAELLKSSQSRVAKMESADPSVSLDLLVRSLLALGISRGHLKQPLR